MYTIVVFLLLLGATESVALGFLGEKHREKRRADGGSERGGVGVVCGRQGTCVVKTR